MLVLSGNIKKRINIYIVKIIKSYKLFENNDDISMNINDILSDVSDIGYNIHVKVCDDVGESFKGHQIFIAIIPINPYHTHKPIPSNFFKNTSDYKTFESSFSHLKSYLKEIGFSLSYIGSDFLHTNHYRLLITFKKSNNYIKEYSNWNPKINKEVKEFVEDHKYNLPQLWDDNLSEDENVEKMIKYFTKYPDEMKSIINGDKLTLPMNKSTNIKNGAPILQNIGGVHDFKSTI